VYWPFHWEKGTGVLIAGLIVIAGVVEVIIYALRKK